MGPGCEMGMGMMVAMGLFWLALLALVAWGLYRLLASRRPAPHEALDRRYASGEISTDDYEERRRTLGE